jgi:hypothetical protein
MAYRVQKKGLGCRFLVLLGLGYTFLSFINFFVFLSCLVNLVLLYAPVCNRPFLVGTISSTRKTSGTSPIGQFNQFQAGSNNTNLNNHSDFIKFIVELEEDQVLLFLDVPMIISIDGTIAHKVYGK